MSEFNAFVEYASKNTQTDDILTELKVNILPEAKY